ncbi:MAG: hypothetical protein K5878_11915 [Rhizobiaceae bacterium]|nr:hypothetical protein [Rhizobiaceae bacterium]
MTFARFAIASIMALAVLAGGIGLSAKQLGGKDGAVEKVDGHLSASVSRSSSRWVVFTAHGGRRIYFGGVWLSFGDGARVQVCRPGRSCGAATASHVYADAGTFKAELRGVGEGTDIVIGAVEVTIDR